ncbi:MAG: hypothetical protein WBF17_07105, partial [Phycisphaerae bacterium]
MMNCSLASMVFALLALSAPGASPDAGLAAAEPAGKVADWLEHEWGEQFDELDRQIRDLRKWCQRVEATTYRAEALILEGDRDPVDVVLRRTEALLRHLKGKLPPGALAEETRQLDALKRRGGATPVKDGRARFAVHQALCRLRRKIAFRNPLLS